MSESRRSSLNSSLLRELTAVAERATLPQPAERFPSVDEFASALRRAAGLPVDREADAEQVALWPVVGIETTSAQLLDRVQRARSRASSCGSWARPGSGRTALLRRVAWSFGVLGSSLAWVEDVSSASSLNAELAAHASLHGVLVLVDDADALERFEPSDAARRAQHRARAW